MKVPTYKQPLCGYMGWYDFFYLVKILQNFYQKIYCCNHATTVTAG